MLLGLVLSYVEHDTALPESSVQMSVGAQWRPEYLRGKVGLQVPPEDRGGKKSLFPRVLHGW